MVSQEILSEILRIIVFNVDIEFPDLRHCFVNNYSFSSLPLLFIHAHCLPHPCILYFVFIFIFSLKEQLNSQEVTIPFVYVCGTGEGSVTANWRLGSR